MDVVTLQKSFTDKLYLSKWLFKMAMVLLVIGGINWLFVGLFGGNPVKAILGKTISRFIYVLVGISAIAIMFNRDTYLPFLGPMVAPCTGLQERIPPGATREVSVTVKPHSKILYWATEPATKGIETVKTWREAYQKYENMGVTISNADGVAVLKVREPQSYSVPWKGTLKPHVHFRVCSDDGFMDRVKTVFLEDGHVEGFQCPMKF